MKYNTIQIQPVSKDKWGVTVTENQGDRVETETEPDGLGFFHFPETMSVEEAFDCLKTKMIKYHQKEIERLEKSLNALQNLTI